MRKYAIILFSDGIGKDPSGGHTCALAGRRGRGELPHLFRAVHGDAAEAALSSLWLYLLRKVSEQGGAVRPEEEAGPSLRCLPHVTEFQHGPILLLGRAQEESVKGVMDK